jgi:hypothetical protein
MDSICICLVSNAATLSSCIHPLLTSYSEPEVVTYVYNHCIREAESEERKIEDQPGLLSKFQVSLRYIETPCLKNTKTKTKQNILRIQKSYQ